MPLMGIAGGRIGPTHQGQVRHTITSGPGTTTITASASANTKGSWTSVLSAAQNPYGITWLEIQLGSTFIAGTRTDYLMDLAWGTAKNMVIENMSVGYRGTYGGATTGENFFVSIPFVIPAGEVLYARIQSDTGSATCKMYVGGFGGQTPGGGTPFQACETIGADTANSRGTQITSKYWLTGGGPTAVTFTPTLPWRNVFFSIGGYGRTSFTAAWVTLDANWNGFNSALQLGYYMDSSEKIIGALPNAMSPYEMHTESAVNVKLYTASGVGEDFDICAHFLS